jgi:S1-C subfamily serine protease
MRQLILCVLSGAIGALFAVWLSVPRASEVQAQEPLQAPGFSAPPTTRGADRVVELSAEEAVAVAVYERANRSVVNITTRSLRSDGFFLMEESSEGSGSGVILDKAGHILTNFHVLEGAKDVSVTLFNGKSYDAEYVGSDAINDVAIIRIEAKEDGLFPVSLGDSGDLKVGMSVFAIGNPFGLERTMTTGIISSLNRSLAIRNNRTIRSIIQIDASINPGNSGGPLLDKNGRLIGINTAIASKTGQSSGVGFAIPVNLLKRVTPQLIKYGKVIRPEIGIQRVYETDEGLLIARLTPEGAAEAAGLRGPLRQRRGPFVVIDRSAADLILKVDEESVQTADDFLNLIESRKSGDTVTLTIRRGGRMMQVSVELKSNE